MGVRMEGAVRGREEGPAHRPGHLGVDPHRLPPGQDLGGFQSERQSAGLPLSRNAWMASAELTSTDMGERPVR